MGNAMMTMHSTLMGPNHFWSQRDACTSIPKCYMANTIFCMESTGIGSVAHFNICQILYSTASVLSDNFAQNWSIDVLHMELGCAVTSSEHIRSDEQNSGIYICCIGFVTMQEEMYVQYVCMYINDVSKWIIEVLELCYSKPTCMCFSH